jgi:putative endonuclease
VSETSSTHRQLTGARGEKLAAAFLERKGYVIESRNFKRLHAEIDLVCRDKHPEGGGEPELVFVEVKTRTSGDYGDPVDAVSPRKITHMLRAAEIYLFEHDLEDVLCRFDVIAIRLGGASPAIEHFCDVIDF